MFEAVARLNCLPADKEEVLGKMRELFACHEALSKAFGTGVKSPAKDGETSMEQTFLKQNYSDSKETTESANGKEKIESMGKKLSALEEKLNRVESDHGNRVEDMSQIRAAQDSICERVANIENKSNELDILQRRIREINLLVAESRGKSSLEDELLKIHQEIASLQGSIQANGQGTQQMVAFSAGFTTDTFHKHYFQREILPFQKVMRNFQDCYNKELSTFIAKIFGLYVFSTSILFSSCANFKGVITHNEIDVASFGAPRGDEQTGTSVVLLLQPGDRVCVKVEKDSVAGFGGESSNFIGYKIA